MSVFSSWPPSNVGIFKRVPYSRVPYSRVPYFQAGPIFLTNVYYVIHSLLMTKIVLRPIQLVERMAQVEKELARRRSRLEIERELSQLWKCTEAEVREVIKAVKARWAAEAQDESRDDRRAAIRASYNDLYSRCVADGDYKTARGTLQDLVALDGLSDGATTNPLPVLVHQVQSPIDIRNQIREIEEQRKKAITAQEYVSDAETEE